MATHSAFLGYLLWLVLGIFGVHRFYFGKRTTGVLYLLAACFFFVVLVAPGTLGAPLATMLYLTAGFIFIGWAVDLFLIPKMKKQVANRFQAGRYSYATGWLLLLFGGVFGAHHFYVGNWKKGLLYLFTLGLLGLGVLYDFFTFNDALSDRNEQWISGEPA